MPGIKLFVMINLVDLVEFYEKSWKHEVKVKKN